MYVYICMDVSCRDSPTITQTWHSLSKKVLVSNPFLPPLLILSITGPCYRQSLLPSSPFTCLGRPAKGQSAPSHYHIPYLYI